MANTINVTDLAVIVAGAITTGQQVTIYDQSGNAGRAAIEDVVAAGRVSPLLDSVIIPVGTTAVTSEETLYTGPTGRWEVGETRRISAAFTTNANNHVKTIKLKFDGVEVYNSATASPTDATPNDARVLVEFDALRVSTTVARVKGMATISNSGSVSAVAVGDITGLAGAVNVVVTITGQNGTATVDDIVLEYVTIVKVN